MHRYRTLLLTLFSAISLCIDPASAQQRPTSNKQEIIKSPYREQRLEATSSLQDSNLTFVGRWPGGPCYAVAAKGNYVFIGDGANFQVVDMSTPESPQVVGETGVGEAAVGEILRMAISGNYVYTVGPLKVIDVSNPTSPQVVFTDTVLLSTLTITVDSTFAYLGDFYGGVYIFDISNPTHPVQRGMMWTYGEQVASIAVKEPYLYATMREMGGVDIFDISNKDSAFEVNSSSGGIGNPLKINGNYLYGGSVIYDITIPDTPKYVGIMENPIIASDVSVRDSLAYLSLGDSGFSVYNVANKTNPVEVAHIPWMANVHARAGKQAISGNYAFLAGGTGLWTVKLGGDSLATASFLSTGNFTTKLAIDSNYAYVACQYAGLKIIDFRYPTAPKVVGNFLTSLPVLDVAIDRQTGFLLTDAELIIIDISDPSAPAEVSRLTFADTVFYTNRASIALSESTIFLSFGASNFRAVDISDLRTPRVIATAQSSDHVYGLSVSGSHLYSAEGSGGMRVYDISNRTSPQAVDTINSTDARAVRVYHNELLAQLVDTFTIFDITNPSRPLKQGSLHTYGEDITASSHFAYLAYSDYLQVVDISNPLAPRTVGYHKRETAFGVGVGNNLVLLGTGDNGLLILHNDLDSSAWSTSVCTSLRNGWNIVSVPLSVDDLWKSAVFPSATSQAFTFSDSGYVAKDSLKDGCGYWLKFSGSQQVCIAGSLVQSETIAVRQGWNMIGSVTRPVLVNAITSIPPALVTSNLFGYSSGYRIADTVVPGHGYWIKVASEGDLILTSSGAMSKPGSQIRRSLTDTPPPPPNGETTSPNAKIPNRYALEQNYPNPFNPSTLIRYSLPVDCYVRLKVYDILGREAATLVDGLQEAGYKSAVWAASAFSSGIYFYRIQAGSFVQTRKLILMR